MEIRTQISGFLQGSGANSDTLLRLCRRCHQRLKVCRQLVLHTEAQLGVLHRSGKD